MKAILDMILIKEVVYPLVIIFIGTIVYIILSKSIKKIFKSRLNRIDKRRSKTLCSLFNNILKYLILIFCVLAILEVYNISTKGLIASLGVVGVVIGLAFQDVMKDLLAGFSIIFENEYAVGDTVTIGDFKGKVISLGLKTTKIQAITGEIKMISNRNIVEVINHSLEDAFTIIEIGVSYEEDVEKVEKVLTDLCQKLEQSIEDVLSIEVQGINELSASSVVFSIMANTKANKQYEVRRKILKEIKIKFDQEKITIPYNQVVVHNARV